MFSKLNQPPLIKTHEVSISSMEIFFEEDGEVVTQDTVEIYAETGGSIVTAFFEDGEQVHKGDMLFKIDVTDLEHELSMVRNGLEELDGERKQAQVTLDQNLKQIETQIFAVRTQRESVRSQMPFLERQKNIEEKKLETMERKHEDLVALYEVGGVPKSDIDESQDLIDLQKITIDTYESQIVSSNAQVQAFNTQESALNDLCNVDSSGQIASFEARKLSLEQSMVHIQKKIEKGEIVSPTTGKIKDPFKKGQSSFSGALLAEIEVTEKYQLESFVRVEDLGGLSVGATAVATLKQNTENIIMDATISKIEKDAQLIEGSSKKRVKVLLDILPSDYENLGVGYSIKVKFRSFYMEDCITVPKNSIYKDGELFTVWVVHEETVFKRVVTLGKENASDVIVEVGLSVGEEIITELKGINLKEGMVINVL